jgi:hypothetical protein
VDAPPGVDQPLVRQTTHFLIIWNIPRITTPDKKNYDAHAAAHSYARRMEAFTRASRPCSASPMPTT